MTTVARPAVAATRAELSAALAAARAAGRPVALVPTMGALHAGHARLISAAAEALPDAVLVVSIFVNPLQFGPGEDFDRYPRSFDADLDLCVENGVGQVFAPDRAEMYPSGDPQVSVVAGPLGGRWEGASRPGHFDGVLTVVAKLFHAVAPDLAAFGEKDYQQLALIRQMVRDLDFPVEVLGVPTVREPDGLALSSRNRYLSAAERGSALALSAALRAATDAAPGGPVAAVAAGRAIMDAEPGVDLDYFTLVDPVTLAEIGAAGSGPARLLVAARVGTTRLLDNAPVTIPVLGTPSG